VTPKATPSQNFGSVGAAQQAAAGFLPTPAVVWEGKPRYRHPPTPPVYPPRAVELNQQGEVLVRVRLDPEGTAVEVVLHRPSGHQMLDRAAIAAVRSWHFLPATRDGRPVSAWVEIPVRFHLR
jgi:protein TonB